VYKLPSAINILFGILFLCVVGLSAEYLGSHVETIHVTVVEKFYTASSTGTGIGPSMGGQGGVVVIVTSSPEKYTLFVKEKNGQPFPVSVSRSTWVSVEKGETIDLPVRIGGVSKGILD